MLSVTTVKEMCKPPRQGMPYFRPLVCKGDLSNVDIFLVGINPATPIRPRDLGLDEYFECLLDYERFSDYYTTIREQEGKRPKSPTRISIDSFVEWLGSLTTAAVAETNVVTYPTENPDALEYVPSWITRRAKAHFFDLLLGFTPSLVILHGKDSVDVFLSLIEKGGLAPADSVDLDEGIRLMETRSPLLGFAYETGKECTVVACRHFRCYGYEGGTFVDFRGIVESFLP